MSIFDGIMGDIQDFSSALAGSLENVGGEKTKSSNNSSNEEYRMLSLEQRLNRNMNQQPYGPNSFQAGKSQPAPQVNSEVINQQWLQRLSKYSTIPQVEGAQGKKA